MFDVVPVKRKMLKLKDPTKKKAKFFEVHMSSTDKAHQTHRESKPTCLLNNTPAMTIWRLRHRIRSSAAISGSCGPPLLKNRATRHWAHPGAFTTGQTWQTAHEAARPRDPEQSHVKSRGLQDGSPKIDIRTTKHTGPVERLE